jgi:hypothetical protein
MIFSEHDFFTNFEGINNSKDTPLMIDLIFSEIAKLIALHKKEILQKIKNIGYTLPDTSDATVIDFLFKRAAADTNVTDMLADMIKKYNIENSNAFGDEGEWGAVISGLGATIGGIFSYAGQAKTAKTNLGISKEQTQQAQYLSQAEIAKAQSQTEQAKLLAQVEAIRAGSKKGLSTGAIIGIVGGGLVLVTLILVLALRKPTVIQTTQN